ncbi:MAG: DUF4249 family protein [Ignavibacteriae bacterium]|nr:DUF4249 family protein [Ignavibacteriota bacterium]
MMRQQRSVITMILFLQIVSGCHQTFDPYGAYEPKLVVYGILSSRSDTQYVRVYSTYPPGVNPATLPNANQVTDANVVVAEGDSTFEFRDTTIMSRISTGAGTPIRIHVAYGFPIIQDRFYRLLVSSPSLGTVTSTTRSLRAGSFSLLNKSVLSAPALSNTIDILVSPGGNVRAYIIRFYIIYEILNGNSWEERTIEVPITLGEAGPVFPRPIPRGGGSPGYLPGTEIIFFSTAAYATTVQQLTAQYPAGTLRLKYARFIYTQMDDAIYAYYNVVNGFPDAGTLRLDEPDFTNIVGGLGIFGTTTERVDTAGLPSQLSF